MPNQSFTQSEPVGVAGAITTALVATVNVLAIVLTWSTEVTAGVNLALGAWVIVATLAVRSRVSPVREAERGW